MQVNGEKWNSTHHLKMGKPIIIKFRTGDYVANSYTHAKFYHYPTVN